MADSSKTYQAPSINNDPVKPVIGFHHFFLLAIILFVLGSNFIWMLLDIRPPSYDQGLHLFRTFNYWEAISSGSEDWWQDVLNVEPFYPPFYHLSLIPLSLVFGFNLDTGVIGKSFFMVVLVLSTYGIGRIIYAKKVGLFASFLVSCYPLIVGMSREYIISVMLTSVTALAYYFFLKSENFENGKYSFLFSLIYASGLMVKWTFFIYTFPAILAGLWGHKLSFRNRTFQFTYYLGVICALIILPFFIYILGIYRWAPLTLELILILVLIKSFPFASISIQKIINLVSLTCISILICFPWYAHNLINILIGMSKFAFPSSVLKGGMAWNMPIQGFYIEVIGRQMGYPLMSITAIAFLFYIFKKEQFNWTLFAWAILPIIVFTFVNNIGARYTMPTLPAMALITSVILTNIKIIPVRKLFLSMTGGTAFATFLYSGFFPPPDFFPYLGQSNHPINKKWPINSILDDIVEEGNPKEGKHLSVRTLANYAYFQRGAFRDFSAFRKLPIEMKGVKRNVGEMTNFFITKSGDFSRQSSNAIQHRNRLLKDPALTKTFKLFRSYPLPDGTKGLVYKFDMEPALNLPGVNNLSLIEKRLIEAFENYPIYGFKNGVNMNIIISPTDDPDDLFYGKYKSIHIKADSVISNKVKIKKFELLFENVQINIYDLLLNGRFILFNLEKLTPRGIIHFDDLEKSAAKTMKGKGNIKLMGGHNSLTITAKYVLAQNQFLKGETKINVLMDPGKTIQPDFEYLKLGPLDIPIIFIRRITNAKIFLNPTPGWPLETNIKSLKFSPRKFEINPDI